MTELGYVSILEERRTGQCDKAGGHYYALMTSIDKGRLGDVPKMILTVIEEGAWKKWRWIGNEFTASTFDEYVENPPPKGLGSSMKMLLRLIADDKAALKALKTVRSSERAAQIKAPDLAEHGTNQHTGGDRDTNNAPMSSRGADYDIRRLRRDAPAIHARVLAGELSPHAGMIEAGFRKKRVRAKKVRRCPHCGHEL